MHTSQKVEFAKLEINDMIIIKNYYGAYNKIQETINFCKTLQEPDMNIQLQYLLRKQIEMAKEFGYETGVILAQNQLNALLVN